MLIKINSRLYLCPWDISRVEIETGAREPTVCTYSGRKYAVPKPTGMTLEDWAADLALQVSVARKTPKPT